MSKKCFNLQNSSRHVNSRKRKIDSECFPHAVAVIFRAVNFSLLCFSATNNEWLNHFLLREAGKHKKHCLICEGNINLRIYTPETAAHSSAFELNEKHSSVHSRTLAYRFTSIGGKVSKWKHFSSLRKAHRHVINNIFTHSLCQKIIDRRKEIEYPTHALCSFTKDVCSRYS